MKFKNAVILGRFQPIHIGHQNLIDLALNTSKRVLVFVGSSDKRDTLRNPFDADYRLELIYRIYEDKINSGQMIVAKLPDLTDENDLSFEWGDYVISSAKSILNENIDCFIYGKEQRIHTCFSNKILENITEIAVPRNRNIISATKLRNYIVKDDKENFEKYTSPKIHSEYEYLKDVLINIENKEEGFKSE